MTQISLKRLVAKKEIAAIINNFSNVMKMPLCIRDAEGRVLIGNICTDSLNTYPIQLADQVLGWVIGLENASIIASLITYLANQEFEKKTLARETLERYKEINILYNISGKLSTHLDFKEIAQLVIDEATKLIPADSASVMLLNEKTGRLEIVAAVGKVYEPQLDLRPGVGIAGSIFQTGRAEILNDIESDPRFIPYANQIKSLICAPLKTQNVVMGVLNISTEAPTNYTAQDLKLAIALASQAASAIENALLHANQLQQERIKSNLERYLSTQLVDAILEAKEDISFAPAKRDITLLFSDIRNFTTKCEELAPEAIVEYLNEYFTHMVEVIFSHRGTVNKFVGDMIVAMFGAPTRLVDSEKRAIETAIEMQKCLKTISVPWIRQNFITGIGISGGEVVVGNVGSPRHMDYTAIGDQVNIASRLQSIAKGEQILVTRRIYEKTHNLFTFKEVGLVQVKGKKNPIEVFEVVY